MAKLRISGCVNDSIVDGPGLRFTLFTQGCPHNCPGCHNPQTHDFKGGYNASIKKIFAQIKANPLLSGVTFSGGEPFVQAKTLVPLAKMIKEAGLELACYTGFVFEQLASDQVKGARELLNYIDLLIDGKFVLSQRSLDLAFKGSKNQRTINVPQSLKEGKVVLEKSERWTKNPKKN